MDYIIQRPPAYFSGLEPSGHSNVVDQPWPLAAAHIRLGGVVSSAEAASKRLLNKAGFDAKVQECVRDYRGPDVAAPQNGRAEGEAEGRRP